MSEVSASGSGRCHSMMLMIFESHFFDDLSADTGHSEMVKLTKTIDNIDYQLLESNRTVGC